MSPTLCVCEWPDYCEEGFLYCGHLKGDCQCTCGCVKACLGCFQCEPDDWDLDQEDES